MPPEGCTVTTDFQNAGRGQHGKQWLSERGANINASVILYPHTLTVADQFLLNMAVACALCEAASALCHQECALKWPNDVYVQNQKIAGILIENSWAGTRWQAAVVGIGMNVNQQDFAGLPATSLRNIYGSILSQEACFDVLFQKLEARYLMLRGPRKEQMLHDYNQLLMHRHEPIKLQFQDGNIMATNLLGATRSGGILVRDALGEIREWHHPQARLML
jgi:BirA family biotin operon repressor/biotin-[acetyl-CoA-carboxylase] ligase